MKTLVAGAVAVLLGSAALVLTAMPAAAADAPIDPGQTTAAPDPGTTTTPPAPAPTEPVTAAPSAPPPSPPAPPAPPLDPIVTITCTQIDVEAQNPPDSGRQFAWAQGRAEKGTPTFLPLSGPLGERLLFRMTLDPGQATAWIFEIRAADGTVLWRRSGTTVPCAPEPQLKYTAPFHPVVPVAACGKTLADLRFPTTPGIAYSYDEWNAYARLLPGWLWDYDAFSGPYAWWIKDSRTSDVAWLPRSAFFMDMAGCPRYSTVTPPMSESPLVSGQRAAGPAPTKSALGPVGVLPSASPEPTALPTRAQALRPTPTRTAAPTAPPRAQPRGTTAAGLGVAGGVAGACVLAAAGAFVVRRRLPPPPGAVQLDEGEPAD